VAWVMIYKIFLMHSQKSLDDVGNLAEALRNTTFTVRKGILENTGFLPLGC